ncbi:MAG: sigma-70 family RNA polymerase sigma factor [Clostridia bacterium]|jgi:RNA polymerase sporulation-specific sigma factor|nr:sigma-70 family RNA polymerase sigma factor [Clostridia bacterium]MBO7296029.1 sigma-70 family RNA polymerase sigma factor [Clostridia bacterium]
MSNSYTKIQRDAEISELLSAARAGNQQAYALLLDRYSPMLQSMVSKYAAHGMSDADLEDLRQEASVVFCSAVQTYDSSREGVEFGLYAKICVGHGLASALRTFRRQRREGLLSLEGEGLIEQNPGLLGSEASVSEALIDKERMEALQRTIQRALSPYESRVWWLYVSGASTCKIASSLGKDEKSISNAIYRIRRKLRQVLGQGDNP